VSVPAATVPTVEVYRRARQVITEVEIAGRVDGIVDAAG
jgi:hypothetical protein